METSLPYNFCSVVAYLKYKKEVNNKKEEMIIRLCLHVLILAVLCYAFIMQILLYSILNDVQDHDGKDRCVFSHILKLHLAVTQELQSLERYVLLRECRTSRRRYGECREELGGNSTTHLCLILDNPQFIYSVGFFYS